MAVGTYLYCLFSAGSIMPAYCATKSILFNKDKISCVLWHNTPPAHPSTPFLPALQMDNSKPTLSYMFHIHYKETPIIQSQCLGWLGMIRIVAEAHSRGTTLDRAGFIPLCTFPPNKLHSVQFYIADISFFLECALRYVLLLKMVGGLTSKPTISVFRIKACCI